MNGYPDEIETWTPRSRELIVRQQAQLFPHFAVQKAFASPKKQGCPAWYPQFGCCCYDNCWPRLWLFSWEGTRRAEGVRGAKARDPSLFSETGASAPDPFGQAHKHFLSSHLALR